MKSIFNKESRSNDPRINVNERFLYIHIPKTGGTSVIKMLGLTASSHIKALEIYNSADKKLLKTKYSFSIVRHPVSRFISLYNYARLEISHYHNNIEPEKALYGKHLDFELLKNVGLNECVDLLMKGQLKHDKSWNHWEPQYTWLFDARDSLLIKKIYKLESLVDFENDFAEQIGQKIKLSVLNKSATAEDTGHQFAQLTTTSMNLLHHYYRKDFELLRY